MSSRIWALSRYFRLLVPYWDKSLLSLFCVGIVVVFGLASPLITKVLIDHVYPGRDLFLLTFLVLLGIVIFIFSTFFSNVSSYLDTYIHQTMAIDLRKKFFAKLLRLPLRFHQANQVGDMMVRVTDDVNVIVENVAELIPVLVKTLFQLAALLIICLMIDWNLTFLALVGIPLYFIQTRFFARQYEELQGRTQKQEAQVMTFYQEKISNIKTIKSFNQEIYETDRLIDRIKKLFQLARENLLLGLFNSFFDSSLITLWTSFLAWYAGYRVITGHITIGEIMAILVYLGQIHRPFLDLGTIYKSLARSFVSINRVNEILAQTPEAYQDSKTYVLFDIDGRLRFDQVSFKYHDAEDFILKDITLAANPGEITALVGASGSGKSTILDLILRFIEPTAGTIYIDAHDLKTVALMTLRAYISIVSQDVVIFSGTIRENLQYGCQEVNEERLVQSCRDAEIHEFITDLPGGYDTPIGAGGLNLSGGQSQRLAIARALYRDVKILVLDEATSSLDSITEAAIFRNLLRRVKHKTVIMITHRPTTLKNANRIYVISDNLVSESGSFDELLKKQGDFYRFYQAALHESAKPRGDMLE